MRSGVIARRAVRLASALIWVLLLMLGAGAAVSGGSPARADVTSNVITIANPGSQSGAVGIGVRIWLRATDSDSAQEVDFEAAGLPPGLAFVEQTGQILGMPSQAGTYTTLVTASDSTGATAAAKFIWTIGAGGGVRVSPAGLGGGQSGVQLSEQVQATDSTPGQALTYGATNLPAGLSIDSSTGVISGAPSAPGISYAVVSASDGTGAVSSLPVTWVVGPSMPAITSPGNLEGNVGTPAWVRIHATDSDPGEVLGFSAQGLPPGLMINYSTGEIYGAPAGAGTYPVTVQAEDQTGSTGSATFTWTVSAATRTTVTVTRPGNQVEMVGDVVSYQIEATDSADGQILTYGATGLPPGLSVDPGTGLITGLVTTPGTWITSVTATDTTGVSTAATFFWTVADSIGGNSITVANPGEQSNLPGIPLSLQITASDSQPGESLTYSASYLPGGLSIDPSTGVISGTPTGATATTWPGYTVVVSATDATGSVGKAAFTWLIANNDAQLLQLGATNPVEPVGSVVSVQDYAFYSNLLVTAPYLATGLPPGLSIDSATGLITGTPTTPGLYWPVFQLDLPVPVIARLTVPWTITPLDGTAVSLPDPGNQNDSVVGSPVSLALQGADSDPTELVSYTASGLPPGLSIDASTGLISGTPVTAGAYQVTVRAYDTTAQLWAGTGAITPVTFLWTVTGS